MWHFNYTTLTHSHCDVTVAVKFSYWTTLLVKESRVQSHITLDKTFKYRIKQHLRQLRCTYPGISPSSPRQSSGFGCSWGISAEPRRNLWEQMSCEWHRRALAWHWTWRFRCRCLASTSSFWETSPASPLQLPHAFSQRCPWLVFPCRWRRCSMLSGFRQFLNLFRSFCRKLFFRRVTFEKEKNRFFLISWTALSGNEHWTRYKYAH